MVKEFLNHCEMVPLAAKGKKSIPLVADDEKAICNAIEKIYPQFIVLYICNFLSYACTQ